jgi:hypothetical protein
MERRDVPGRDRQSISQSAPSGSPPARPVRRLLRNDGFTCGIRYVPHPRASPSRWRCGGRRGGGGCVGAGGDRGGACGQPRGGHRRRMPPSTLAGVGRGSAAGSTFVRYRQQWRALLSGQESPPAYACIPTRWPLPGGRRCTNVRPDRKMTSTFPLATVITSRSGCTAQGPVPFHPSASDPPRANHVNRAREKPREIGILTRKDVECSSK